MNDLPMDSWTRAAALALAITSLLTATPAEAQAPDPFTVIGLNIWQGGTNAGPVGAGKCTADPAPTSRIGFDAALFESADFVASRLAARGTTRGVVAIQEVYADIAASSSNSDGITEGTINEAVSLAAKLTTKLGNTWTGSFGETAGAAIGTRGNGIVTNIGSPSTNKVQSEKFMWDLTKKCKELASGGVENAEQCDYGEHPRGLTAVRLSFPSTPGRVAWVVSVHLDGILNGTVASRQVFELLGTIKRFDPDMPVIVLGDFNVKPSL